MFQSEPWRVFPYQQFLCLGEHHCVLDGPCSEVHRRGVGRGHVCREEEHGVLGLFTTKAELRRGGIQAYMHCGDNHGDGLHGTHAGVETAENDFPAVSMFVDCLENDVSHHVTLKVREVESRVLCV